MLTGNKNVLLSKTSGVDVPLKQPEHIHISKFKEQHSVEWSKFKTSLAGETLLYLNFER